MKLASIFFQCFAHNLCFSAAYHGFKRLERSLLDTLDALEVGEQRLLSFRSYSLDGIECRGCLPFAALVAVESDGKAVYLVLYALE